MYQILICYNNSCCPCTDFIVLFIVIQTYDIRPSKKFVISNGIVLQLLFLIFHHILTCYGILYITSILSSHIQKLTVVMGLFYFCWVFISNKQSVLPMLGWWFIHIDIIMLVVCSCYLLWKGCLSLYERFYHFILCSNVIQTIAHFSRQKSTDNKRHHNNDTDNWHPHL